MSYRHYGITPQKRKRPEETEGHALSPLPWSRWHCLGTLPPLDVVPQPRLSKVCAHINLLTTTYPVCYLVIGNRKETHNHCSSQLSKVGQDYSEDLDMVQTYSTLPKEMSTFLIDYGVWGYHDRNLWGKKPGVAFALFLMCNVLTSSPSARSLPLPWLPPKSHLHFSSSFFWLALHMGIPLLCVFSKH